jgi:hypothetical protein
MSLGRKMRRAQARELAKTPELAKAVGSLKGLRPAIDDTQTAVVQVLEELDNLDYQVRRQRAVFLRMVMEIKGAYKPKFVINHHTKSEPSDPLEEAQELEKQYCFEYDALYAISRGLMLKAQAEAQSKEES